MPYLMQGVVHFGADVLGWRPVVRAWLARRNLREAHTLLTYFEKMMDIIVDCVVCKIG